MDEERLLVEAAQKDPRRFGELYEGNFDRVYAFIARRVGDRHEAEDVTAEVFQHALANLSKFEWRGVPFAVCSGLRCTLCAGITRRREIDFAACRSVLR